jgi:hypothetical protein
MDEMTIEELKEYAERYFEEIIKIMIKTEEGTAEYDSHVDELEAMSDAMDDQSYGYLKLKVTY